MLNITAKRLLILSLILTVSTLSIVVLFFLKGTFSFQKNGFKRSIRHHAIRLDNEIKNTQDIVAVVGKDANHFYFTSKMPGIITATNKELQERKTLNIPLRNANRIKTGFETQIVSPNIYLFGGNVPAIYISQINNFLDVKTYHLPAIYSRSIIVNDNTILLRIVKKEHGKSDQVFAKFDASTRYIHYEKGVSELHGDLGFSTDGLLHYDAFSKLAVYVEFYRNRVTVFDTSFKIAYKAHTIDTFSVNTTNYNMMTIGNKKNYTNISPKHMINSESCVDNGKLFVQSELIADNEQEEEFSKNSVIDIYAIKDGRYLWSFYVPFDSTRKLWRFKVFGNILVAIYKDHIATYKINMGN